MSTEQQKLDAARGVVADSVLHGWTDEAKAAYVRQVLPGHYKVNATGGNVHCQSSTGIDDEEQWGYVMSAFRQRFGTALKEVYHHTCTNHLSFTVYLN